MSICQPDKYRTFACYIKFIKRNYCGIINVLLCESGVKNFNQIELAKKIIQVVANVICIHTNYGEHGLSSFRDIATFKFGQISLSDHIQKFESNGIKSKNPCK